MNEQENRPNEQPSEPQGGETESIAVRESKHSRANLFQYVLMGMVFVAVTALVFLLTKSFANLTTPLQQWMYPLFCGFLLGGLTVLWLYYHTSGEEEPHREPKIWFFPVLAGALTLMIAAIAYACVGMWPVGQESPMIVDMHHQYLPMLAQMRDMLLHGGSPLYSFEIGTGTSFIPLFGYYLASPLNLLLLLFPQAYLPEGILVITLIKLALTGSMMTLCLQYVFRRRNYATVAVGIMYALMMYMLAYSWNIMWLDCVMFLPLIIMGFERMMRTGKYLLYILSLAYTLYANYYIGFMVCLFLVLYYLVFFFRTKRTGAQQKTGFARFAIGSLLGGGLAMITLIPVILSLSSTSAAGGTLPAFASNFDFFDLFGRSLFATSPTIRSGNLPNIYCGVLAVIALPIFATMKSIPFRRRMSYLSLFGFMAVSLVLKQLDMLWHGLHAPNDLPYRFSFLYCFALLLITYEVLNHIRDIRPAQIGGSLLGIAIYLIVEEKFGSDEYSYVSLYVSFALIAVYAAILFAASRKKLMLRSAYTLLLLVISGEMLFNSSVTFGTMNENEHYTDHSAYLDNDITKAVSGAVSRMEEIGDEKANGDFYRLEFLPRRTTADTALFDYRGITVFASSGSYNMTRFMGSLGYDVNGVNSQLYRSFVPSSDSLMGIRYLALESNLTNHPQLQQLESVQSGDSTYYIYENPYALPLGFMTDNAVKTWHYSYYNPPLTQNSLFAAMTGNNSEIMHCQQITCDGGATVNGVYDFSISGAQTAVFRSTIAEEGQIFVYVDCRAAESVSVSLGLSTWNVTPHQPYIIDVGKLAAGSEVTVNITTENSASGNIYVCRLDESVFRQDMQTLSAQPLKVTSFSDTIINGTVHANEAGVLCTTIPFDKGWSVKVDGTEVQPFAMGEALLAVDLQPGDHEITFTFFPKGLIPGAVISVISLVCLIFFEDFLKRRDTGTGLFPFRHKETEQNIRQETHQDINRNENPDIIQEPNPDTGQGIGQDDNRNDSQDPNQQTDPEMNQEFNRVIQQDINRDAQQDTDR